MENKYCQQNQYMRGKEDINVFYRKNYAVENASVLCRSCCMP